MEPKTAQSSIESLSHISPTSNSPRLESAAMSEDLYCSSLRSEDGKVRFMCSYGGRIMPRPHDCQLRYVGGETRILVVNRSITLADLMGKLTRLCGRSVQLKYQLPNEDMDSLVSVLSDEDLESMMEEYDRLEIRDASSTRLRLFLFPAKSYSASAVDLPEYDARNAEQRFVDAVNGIARRQQSLPTSQTQLPDYLFGLDMSDKLDSAPSNINTQPLLRGARCFLLHDGLLANDHQLPLQNYSPVQKDPSHKQQLTQLDPLIYFSNQATISVADHLLEGLEPIKQFSPVISAPPVDTHAGEKQPISETTLPRNLQKKPEFDSVQDLNLMSASEDPHESAKGSTSSAQIDEKLQLKDSSTQTTLVVSKSVEFQGESKVVEATDSYKAQIQHLMKTSHDPSTQYSNEHENSPSSPQKIIKFVSDEVNDRDGSSFQGQQEIISNRSEQYHKEGYAFEDSDNPLRSTITSQHNNNQQQNFQNFQHHAAIHQWQGEVDQMRLQQHIQQSRSSAFLHPPANIPRAVSAPILLRTHDVPRSAHRQCVVVPQPTNLQRQLSAAPLPYSELQQQQPVRIMGGQSTGRDQTATRISRVQSPSRFRDRSPSTAIHGHWINPEAETRQLLRTCTQHPSRGSLPQHDHYVDPNKHVLCDPSGNSQFSLMMSTDSQLKQYADHINSSELNHFSADIVAHMNDQTLDSHAYQGAYLHHGNEQQAGSTEPHRHVQLHQVMRT